MAKDRDRKRIIGKLERLEGMERDFHKEKKKIAIHCCHQNEKGKLKIYPYEKGKTGDYQCKYCKTIFNMNHISKEELKDALSTLHNAIQQIRSFADCDKDEKIIMLLGELDFNLHETKELYERYADIYGKRNKKKKDRDDIGSYGVGSISFIGGKKK